MANQVISVNNARIIHKNGIEANWNRVNDFIPEKGEIIIYNPDDQHPTPRFKIGNGVSLPRYLPFFQSGITQDDLDNLEITAEKLKHSLIFGADGEFVFDGSRDVTVPVYMGQYT